MFLTYHMFDIHFGMKSCKLQKMQLILWIKTIDLPKKDNKYY